MRSTFISPSPQEFGVILDTVPIKQIRGGALDDIEIFRVPARSLRGSGLFSALAGIARRVVPFLARAVKPSVLEFGKNVLTDMQEGNTDIRSSLKKRGIEALGTTGRRLLTGKGKKRRSVKGGVRKKKKKKGSCKKRRYKDVFGVI